MNYKKNFFSEIKNINKDVKLIAASIFFFSSGLGFINYYVPILLRNIGAGSSQIGIVFSEVTVISALSALAAGFIIHKFDIRKYLLLTNSTAVLYSLILLFALNWKYGLFAGFFWV